MHWLNSNIKATLHIWGRLHLVTMYYLLSLYMCFWLTKVLLIILSLCSWSILVFSFLIIFFWFWYWSNVGLMKWSGNYTLLSVFWKNLYRIGIVPLFSNFQWEIWYHSYLCSSVSFFPLVSFKIFLFINWSSNNFIIMYLIVFFISCAWGSLSFFDLWM